MLQRLPIALAQVKAANTSENLLNEIRQIIYSLHWAKESAEKVSNKTINSVKFYKVIKQNAYYLQWILKIKEQLILTDYYAIFQTK